MREEWEGRRKQGGFTCLTDREINMRWLSRVEPVKSWVPWTNHFVIKNLEFIFKIFKWQTYEVDDEVTAIIVPRLDDIFLA